MENGVVYEINRYCILFGNMLLNIMFATSVICLRYVCVIVCALFLFLLFVLCDGDCLIINIHKKKTKNNQIEKLASLIITIRKRV